MTRAELLDEFEADLPAIRRGEPGEVFALDVYAAEIVVVDEALADSPAAEKFAARATGYLWKYSINGLRGPEDLGGQVMKKWLVVELGVRAKRFAEKERYRVAGRTPGALTRLKWWLTDAGPS